MHPNRIEEQTIFIYISKTIGRINKILPMNTKSKVPLTNPYTLATQKNININCILIG